MLSTPLAVLIDAENIAADHFAHLKELVHEHGDPIIWRVFGDLSCEQTASWQALARREVLEVCHHFHYARNSADIAMTIAAMDICHAGYVQGICIVSSDSDFLPLARRLRASNLAVYGFGEKKTADRLRSVYTIFRELHRTVAKQPALPAARDAALTDTNTRDTQSEELQLYGILCQLFAEYHTNGRMSAKALGEHLSRHPSNIAQRYVGKGLTKHLKSLNFVEKHGEGTAIFLSLKPLHA